MNSKKSMKKDVLTDWYAIANKQGTGHKITMDKHFKNHLIKPYQMISIIGPTGSGKSTAIVEFLSRKNESFYEVTIFSGSTSDEPLYNMLKKLNPDINIIDNVDELPDLVNENDKDKKQEKLMIFDDIINLNKKNLLTIQKWFNSARKYGYTCIAMAQNYTDLPIQIRRNTMIFWLFRMNDNNSINQILKNHNHTGIDKETIKNMYYYCIKEKKNFFNINFNDETHPFKKNFIEILNPSDFE
jgi:hypothetical protein